VVPLSGGVAGAVTEPTGTCKTGQFPVVDGGTSNLIVDCLTQAGDPGANVTAERITDFPNAQWHNGAAHQVVVNCSAGSPTLTLVAGTANGVILPSDVGKSITSVVLGAKAPLPAKDFIVSRTSTTITLAQNTLLACVKSKVLIENGYGRASDDASYTNADNHVTSVGAHFTSDDVNMTLSGTDIPEGTTITGVAGNIATISNNTTAAGSGQPISIDSNAALEDNFNANGLTPARTTSTRMISDLTTTKLSATVSSPNAHFSGSDIGLLVQEKGVVAANVYITAIGAQAGANPWSNSATLSANALKTGTGLAPAFFGLPSASAPVAGDYAVQLATAIELSPSLVDGVRPCSEDVPTGTLLDGSWQNPGSKTFDLATPFNNLDLNWLSDAVIGELGFKTSVVDFAAFVSQASTGYNIKFPFLPTVLAICPTTNNASSYTFLGETHGQSSLVQGWGKPGSVGLRAIESFEAASGSVTTSATVDAWDWDSNTTTPPQEGDKIAFGGTSCHVIRPQVLDTYNHSFPCNP